MQMIELIQRLCAIDGVSGDERAVAEAIIDQIKDFCEYQVSPLGDIIAFKKGEKRPKNRVLFDAHMDEVGFIVTGHEEGFLRFTTLGGVDSRILPDRELFLLTKPPAFGVVSCMPSHLQSGEDADKALAIDKLFLDVAKRKPCKNSPSGLRQFVRADVPSWGQTVFAGRRWTTGLVLPFCWTCWSSFRMLHWTAICMCWVLPRRRRTAPARLLRPMGLPRIYVWRLM